MFWVGVFVGMVFGIAGTVVSLVLGYKGLLNLVKGPKR